MSDRFVAPAEPMPQCDLCHGMGEYHAHADDCGDSLCALNGDEHSCAGQVVRCDCTPLHQEGEREAFERWAQANGYAGHDDMLTPLDRSMKALLWSAWQARAALAARPAEGAAPTDEQIDAAAVSSELTTKRGCAIWIESTDLRPYIRATVRAAIAACQSEN